jgi:hypothetical protein
MHLFEERYHMCSISKEIGASSSSSAAAASPIDKFIPSGPVW